MRRQTTMNKLLLTLLCALTLLAAACSASETGAPELDGTSWTLAGFSDGQLFDDALPGVVVTISFEGGQASGSGGCNQFGGQFTLDGSTIDLTRLMSTVMGCLGEEGPQESRFIDVLSRSTAVEITDDGRLLLSPPEGERLVFVRL